MKIILFFVLLFFVCHIYAQQKASGVWKFYPLNIAGGHVNIGYEYVLSKKSSLELNGSYYYFSWLTDVLYEQAFPYTFGGSGIAARLSYRKYIRNNIAPMGTYFLLQIGYKYFDTKEIIYDVAFERIDIIHNKARFIVGLGRQGHSGNFFWDVSGGLGVSYHFNREDYVQFIDDDPFYVPAVYLSLSIGIGQ